MSTTTMRRSILFILLLAVSSSAAAAPPPPLNLASLTYCGLVKITGIEDNLSGCCVHPADGSLLLVVNNPPILARYIPWNATLTRLEDVGFAVTDSEGLAWLGANPFTARDEIAVSQEADAAPVGDDASVTAGQRVVVFDARTLAPTGESYHLSALDSVVPHNKGLEGVTYDPGDATFYVVREKREMAVYSFQRDLAIGVDGVRQTKMYAYFFLSPHDIIPLTTHTYHHLRLAIRVKGGEGVAVMGR